MEFYIDECIRWLKEFQVEASEDLTPSKPECRMVPEILPVKAKREIFLQAPFVTGYTAEVRFAEAWANACFVWWEVCRGPHLRKGQLHADNTERDLARVPPVSCVCGCMGRGVDHYELVLLLCIFLVVVFICFYYHCDYPSENCFYWTEYN